MNKNKRGPRNKTIFGTLGTVALAGAGLAQAEFVPAWMRLVGAVCTILAIGLSAWIGIPRLKRWLDEIPERDA